MIFSIFSTIVDVGGATGNCWRPSFPIMQDRAASCSTARMVVTDAPALLNAKA